MIAVRFNSDGSLDDGTAYVDTHTPYDTTPGDSFGASGGVASVNFNTGTSGDDHAYAAALSPDGSIVLAGDRTDTGVLNMAAVRLSGTDGTLDTSFASGGKATGFTSAVSTANAVAVDGLGRVTLAGQVIHTAGEHDFALKRFNQDGSIDGTFGNATTGQAQTNFVTASDDQAYALALTATGGAVAAGGSSGDFAVARYAPGGTTSSTRLYPVQDANYNVTALVSSGGSVQQRFVYDPYGTSTVLSSSWGSASDGFDWNVRWQGGRLDTATGNYNFQHRDYDPDTGRAIQPDPAGYPDGTNRYQWEMSSPADRLDPSGLVAGAVPLVFAGGSGGLATEGAAIGAVPGVGILVLVGVGIYYSPEIGDYVGTSVGTTIYGAGTLSPYWEYVSNEADALRKELKEAFRGCTCECVVPAGVILNKVNSIFGVATDWPEPRAFGTHYFAAVHQKAFGQAEHLRIINNVRLQHGQGPLPPPGPNHLQEVLNARGKLNTAVDALRACLSRTLPADRCKGAIRVLLASILKLGKVAQSLLKGL